MNPLDDKDDLLAIPAFLKREPKPGAPITAQPVAPTPATTPPERIWIMPKSTKSKPAKSQKTDPAVVAAKKAAKASKKQRGTEPKAKTPRTNKQAADSAAPRKQREGTKQAKLIEMLRRPEGATIAQIVAATKWQQHTVRGAIAGALKKKLGLAVTSEKVDGSERVYRLTD